MQPVEHIPLFANLPKQHATQMHAAYGENKLYCDQVSLHYGTVNSYRVKLKDIENKDGPQKHKYRFLAQPQLPRKSYSAISATIFASLSVPITASFFAIASRTTSGATSSVLVASSLSASLRVSLTLTTILSL